MSGNTVKVNIDKVLASNAEQDLPEGMHWIDFYNAGADLERRGYLLDPERYANLKYAEYEQKQRELAKKNDQSSTTKQR